MVKLRESPSITYKWTLMSVWKTSVGIKNLVTSHFSSLVLICMSTASTNQRRRKQKRFHNYRVWNLTSGAICKHCYVLVPFKIITNLLIEYGLLCSWRCHLFHLFKLICFSRTFGEWSILTTDGLHLRVTENIPPSDVSGIRKAAGRRISRSWWQCYLRRKACIRGWGESILAQQSVFFSMVLLSDITQCQLIAFLHIVACYN